MRVVETDLKDVYFIEPRVFRDERGYFFESYNEKLFHEFGFPMRFVQDNESMSSYGVVRGLHYQLAPYAQCKLISAIQVCIYDVVDDLR